MPHRRAILVLTPLLVLGCVGCEGETPAPDGDGTAATAPSAGSSLDEQVAPDRAADAEAGIGQNLVRLSVGLESTEDLVADILAALDAADKALSLAPVAVA